MSKIAFVDLIKILRNNDVEICSLKYTSDTVRDTIDIIIKVKGSFNEITSKLERLTKELKPFTKDEFNVFFLDVQSGIIDLFKKTVFLELNIFVKGINVSIE